MVLRTKSFNILGVHWKIQFLEGGLEKPIYSARLPKKREWVWIERGGGVFQGGWYPNAHYDYFVSFEVIEKRFTKIKFKYFNGNCNYSNGQVYALPHKSLAFCKTFLWTSFFVFNCILLRQAISLKKMVVLSVKFTILFSRSPVCIPLILLSALMRLAGTSAAVLHNILDSRHHCRTHTGVTGSNRSYRINSRLF